MRSQQRSRPSLEPLPRSTMRLLITGGTGVLGRALRPLAEAEGHHPALLTEWGRVTVSWWTHKIKGLHRNDFVMAAKTDALAEG